MSPKWRVWLAGGLLAAVIAAALYFPALRRQVDKAKQLTELTAEQARRELLPPAPITSGDPKVLRLLPAYILNEGHVDQLRAALSQVPA